LKGKKWVHYNIAISQLDHFPQY